MAEQLEFFPVQSPCRGICQTDERGYCRGCFRSREERFNWQTMSDAQKQEVLRLCRQRLLRKITREQAGAGGRTAATLTVLSQKLRILRALFY
ncbi:oxidoreductase [Klebsiella pneumoniae]|uniref:Oxidoreductase n=1 Tax=Klebsiella pneumoniae TaxID=573 RepID=A0A377W343_KLEPN|nr:oxidoreductase [Klebsiella pneumoniae]